MLLVTDLLPQGRSLFTYCSSQAARFLQPLTITTTSGLAYRPYPSVHAYSSTKAAVNEALCESYKESALSSSLYGNLGEYRLWNALPIAPENIMSSGFLLPPINMWLTAMPG